MDGFGHFERFLASTDLSEAVSITPSRPNVALWPHESVLYYCFLEVAALT
jgi:hypothetical protein